MQFDSKPSLAVHDASVSRPGGATKLLFVIGMWRSGTSLMHALLNQHSQIALLYESESLDLWPRDTLIFPRRDWPRRLEFFNQAFTRHDLDPEHFTSVSPGPDAALALYSAYGLARNATIIGGKAPSYHSRLPSLRKLFPDAQFLIIWRDPLDCCRSATRAAAKNRFFGQHGMMQRILLGAESLACGVEKLRREEAGLCEIVYDDLVKNPEKELRRVCDFLKIPFEPRMLDLKSADVSSVPDGEHHETLRSGVIGKTANAGEILPDALVAKGRRYAKFWRERFSHLGFARALTCPAEAGPSSMERFTDRCVRTFWRGVDETKRFLFRHMPFSWWMRLRTLPRPGNKRRGN